MHVPEENQAALPEKLKFTVKLSIEFNFMICCMLFLLHSLFSHTNH